MWSNANNPQHLTTKGPADSYRCIFVGSCIFFWIVSSTHGAPTTPTTETTPVLTKLGYLSVTSRNFAKGPAAKTGTQSLKDSKILTDLNSTDHLESPDPQNRYVLYSKWSEKMHFTYRIHNFPQSLCKDIVEYEIAQAFGVWSGFTDLTFTPKKEGSADINISFLESNHGHTRSFDGRGGTLAHANFPGDQLELTVHFDAAENWTSRSRFGKNLFQVAVHEIGHTLGLGHSDVRAAVMWYGYKKYDPNYQLHEDDIEGIQKLYGTYDLMLMIITLIKDVVHIFF